MCTGFYRRLKCEHRPDYRSSPKFTRLRPDFKADIVIIGAAALLCFMDIGRFTRDIDLALALGPEGFTAFADELSTLA